MTYNFNTNRLIIEQYIEDGVRENTAQQTIHILSSEVTKYLPDGWQNINSVSDAEGWLKERIEESIVLLIHTIDTSELVGFIFLYPIELVEGKTDFRFGYLLAKSIWGKGFGTEIVNGLVSKCLELGYVNSLLGGVEVDNIGSIKVLEKCGFNALKQEQGMEHIIFYEKRY